MRASKTTFERRNNCDCSFESDVRPFHAKFHMINVPCSQHQSMVLNSVPETVSLFKKWCSCNSIKSEVCCMCVAACRCLERIRTTVYVLWSTCAASVGYQCRILGQKIEFWRSEIVVTFCEVIPLHA